MQKTVRVGYVNAATYEEGGEGEYKRGYGYEYLQRISYVTGWHYEYVYGSFKECSDTLGGVALAESSYVEREVTLADFIREHSLMVLGWLLLFIMVLAGMLYALFVNGRKLKAALDGGEGVRLPALSGQQRAGNQGQSGRPDQNRKPPLLLHKNGGAAGLP